jgi:hypothetical protein
MDENKDYNGAFGNAQDGLDKNGKPFKTFEGPDGTVIDSDGNKLPKNKYGEYIRP